MHKGRAVEARLFGVYGMYGGGGNFCTFAPVLAFAVITL